MTARPHLSGALQAAWGYPRVSPTELRAGQDAALRRLSVHAYEQVRYYRRLFERHRLHPRHLRGVVDLELVPLTERTDLLTPRREDVLARGADPASLLEVPIEERAGAPLLRRTWLEDLLQLIHRMRALAALGLHARDRVAVVGGSQELGRHGLALHLLGLHRRRLFDGDGEPGSCAGNIAAYRPDVVVGAPATLDRLAAGGGADGRLRPRLVVVEGRPPMPHLRSRLAEAFGAPVRATYGIGASTPLATECAATGAYHVADGWALVEVLVDGRPARPGERGEVAVTLLHSFAMPVLRLRVGHVATRGGPCACGAHCSTILAPDA